MTLTKLRIRNEAPLISIIIPVYNRKKLVIEAIESGLDQSYPNKEVVVVDDGSEDNTYETVKVLDAPIVLHSQPHKGQSAARNLGLFSCKGDYVLFLDSDDVLEPDAIRILWRGLSELEKVDPKWGASYGKKLTCNANLVEVKNRPRKYYSGSILPHLLHDNFVRTGTFLVRKSILKEVGGFREDLHVKEDLHLLFSIAARYDFVFVNKAVARHRRHGGIRARGDKLRIIEQGTKHLDYFFSECKSLDPSIANAKSRVYANEHLQLSKMAWRSHLPSQFLCHWKAACSYDKRFYLHPKYLMRALISAVTVGSGR